MTTDTIITIVSSTATAPVDKSRYITNANAAFRKLINNLNLLILCPGVGPGLLVEVTNEMSGRDDEVAEMRCRDRDDVCVPRV